MENEVENQVEKTVEKPQVSVAHFDSADKNLENMKNQDIQTKWNWGAFIAPMFFGIANRAYLGLLILIGMIPFLGWIFAIVWMIVFGLNGEKYALENADNHYRDNEEFRKVMDGWNRVGLVYAIIAGAVIILNIILFLVILATGVSSTTSNY